MSKSLTMIAVVDGKEVVVGTCHPGQARILRKQGMADFVKGKIVLKPRPTPAKNGPVPLITTHRNDMASKVRANFEAAMREEFGDEVYDNGRLTFKHMEREPAPPTPPALFEVLKHHIPGSLTQKLWQYAPGTEPDVPDMSPEVPDGLTLSAEQQEVFDRVERLHREVGHTSSTVDELLKSREYSGPGPEGLEPQDAKVVGKVFRSDSAGLRSTTHSRHIPLSGPTHSVVLEYERQSRNDRPVIASIVDLCLQQRAEVDALLNGVEEE